MTIAPISKCTNWMYMKLAFSMMHIRNKVYLEIPKILKPHRICFMNTDGRNSHMDSRKPSGVSTHGLMVM